MKCCNINTCLLLLLMTFSLVYKRCLTIMNIKMIEETLVRNHMVCMIRLFKKLEILEAKMDCETKVDMISKTLLDSFRQFKLNYSINKMMNLPELMSKLQMLERFLNIKRVFI
ncbi:hypothetical protein AAG906_016959 [Vitis piasezkii]